MPYYDPNRPETLTNRPRSPGGLSQWFRPPSSVQQAGQQFGAGIRQTGQVLGSGLNAAMTPFRMAAQSYGDLASGVMQGIRGQQPPTYTDAAVGMDAQTAQQPRSLVPQNMPDAPQNTPVQPRMTPQQTRGAQLSLAQSQSPIGVARSQGQGTTTYQSPQGMAQFQGQRRGGGGFVGGRTDAEVQARQADYARRGLNVYGNDMRAIDQLNQIGDQMQRARLSNVITNPQYSNRQAARAMGGLAQMQEGQQARQDAQYRQQQAQAQQAQQGFENDLAARRQVVDEMLAGATLSEKRRAQIAQDPFSRDSLREVQRSLVEKTAGSGMDWVPDFARYVMVLGGLYNPETNEVLNPADVAELDPQTVDRLRAYAMGQ